MSWEEPCREYRQRSRDRGVGKFGGKAPGRRTILSQVSDFNQLRQLGAAKVSNRSAVVDVDVDHVERLAQPFQARVVQPEHGRIEAMLQLMQLKDDDAKRIERLI